MKPLTYRKADRDKRAPRPKRHRMHVAKGDTVRVVRGAFAGTEGTVLRVLPKENRVVIEGVNVVKRHKRATQETEGGIIQFPAPIHASNVMLLDPKSGEPTRIRRRRDKDGTVERLSVKSGQSIPRNR